VADEPCPFEVEPIEDGKHVVHVCLDREGRPAGGGFRPPLGVAKRGEDVVQLGGEAVEVVRDGRTPVQQKRGRAGTSSVAAERAARNLDLERLLAHRGGAA